MIYVILLLSKSTYSQLQMVAQHLEIISKNFLFSTRRTRILMGFITWYLVLIVNPMGRILVRGKSFRNHLEMLCHPICNRLYFGATATSSFRIYILLFSESIYIMSHTYTNALHHTCTWVTANLTHESRPWLMCVWWSARMWWSARKWLMCHVWWSARMRSITHDTWVTANESRQTYEW